MKIFKKRGFSISELIAAGIIVIVTLTVAVELFIGLHRHANVLMSYLDSYLKGRETVDVIAKDSRMAVKVMDNFSGFTSTDNCIILKVPSIDETGAIIDVNKIFDYIVYRWDSNNIIRTVVPDVSSSREAAEYVMKEGIQTMLFTYNNTPFSSVGNKSIISVVTIQLSIQDIILGKSYTVTPATTVKLMNYEWEFIR